MTKQRKLFTALLALAGAGFGYDRLFMGGGVTGPSTASASSLRTADLLSRTPADDQDTPARAPDTTARVARLLGTLAQMPAPAGVPDAFALPPGWLTRIPGASASPPANDSPLDRLSITALVPGRGAIIDGRYVMLGQERGDIRLVGMDLLDNTPPRKYRLHLLHVPSGRELSVERSETAIPAR